MNRQRKWMIRLLILIVAALSWGICLGFAQNNGNGNGNNGNGNGNGHGNGNGQVKNCQNGQMRCIDNDTRWQVAINNHKRRADDINKHGVQPGNQQQGHGDQQQGNQGNQQGHH